MFGKHNRRGKCNEGIMANSHFGDVTVYASGIAVTIPQTTLDRDGSIPKTIQRDIANVKTLSIGAAEAMNEKFGITIIKEAI